MSRRGYGLQIRYASCGSGNLISRLSFLGHYSCFGALLTSVAKINKSVPVTLSPDKDNGSYSSPTPAPNDGLPR